MLLTLLAIVTLGVMRVRQLFAVVVLSGAYSFLMASVMVILDGVDVAMTEASVGAGISTVLLLGALHLTKTREAEPRYTAILPMLVAIGTGVMLVYGTWELPAFGVADSPMNTGVGAYYIEHNYHDTHIPNIVTAVLASYRGFDTLGEVAVIFTAGIGVMLLLKRYKTED